MNFFSFIAIIYIFPQNSPVFIYLFIRRSNGEYPHCIIITKKTIAIETQTSSDDLVSFSKH